MNATTANVSKDKRISAIWILPILVLAIGGWVVFRSILNQGPEIEIEFATADGLSVDKTKIKVRNIELGVVSEIRLGENYEKVIVKARLENEAIPLLTEDAVFWVVKPRVGATGISGVGTLLSGAYIELEPGFGEPGRRSFVGTESIPSAPPNAAGKRILLHSSLASSVGPGDPVDFRGYRVGKIESTDFDFSQERFEYTAFIEAPYDVLVTTSTRFWNSSGVAIEANADGLSLKASSLESMMSGGVTFDLPDRAKQGQAIQNGHLFQLFPSERSVRNEPFAHYIEYLLMFDTSVRGLRKGAPVEYRGIKIGSVSEISFDLLPEESVLELDQIPVPVRIRIDPARIDMEDTEEACKMLATDIERRISTGMRASLETGSLLTGNLYVSVDFHKDAEPAEIEMLGDYKLFPTVSTGLAQIEKKVVQTLDKILELPLDETFASAGSAIGQAEETLLSISELSEQLNAFLTNQELQKLPESARITLDSLNDALKGFSPESDLQDDIGVALRQISEAMRSLEELADTIKAKPNSLIFSGKRKNDPQPKGNSSSQNSPK